MAEHAEYHFAGPILGPLGIIVGLPLVCYLLVYSCNDQVITSTSFATYTPRRKPALAYRSLQKLLRTARLLISTSGSWHLVE